MIRIVRGCEVKNRGRLRIGLLHALIAISLIPSFSLRTLPWGHKLFLARLARGFCAPPTAPMKERAARAFQFVVKIERVLAGLIDLWAIPIGARRNGMAVMASTMVESG